MARDKALWDKIRADFLATGKSYPDLAAEYGVSISTLKKRAARECWTLEKKHPGTTALRVAAVEQKHDEPEEPTGKQEPEPREEPEPEPRIKTGGERKNQLEIFIAATDGMMERILDAIQSDEVIKPYALKHLTSALRDIREMQGLARTELDIEEQKARIAKLRSETRTVEDNGESGVIILPPMDARPTPPGDDNA